LLLHDHGCSLGKIYIFFSFWNKIVPYGNISPSSPKNMVFFEKKIWAINFLKLSKGNLFSSISFMDEKKYLRKGSNPRPLGYKGDSNHCISSFLLRIIKKHI
jgi:hypothetical protein